MKNSTLLFVVLFFPLCACNKPAFERPHVINIGVQYEIEKLDPHATRTLGNWAILSNFYEALVSVDSSMRIQPCLAGRWENPDIYTWIFHLQPNVRFHNGRHLEARDVVYSIDRVLKSNLDVSSYLTEVTDVNEVDRLTVRVRTKSALPIFLNRLSNIAIVPEGSTTADLETKESGTGAYKLTGYSKDQVVRMERDDQYWGKKPDVRYVNYYLKQSPEQAVRELEAEKFQLIQYDSKKLEPMVRSLGHYTILRQDNYYLKHIGFDVVRDVTPYCDVKRNPFRSLLVREAIYAGIDRHELINRLPTYAVIASQPVPPFVFGFNPVITAPEYSQQRATALLVKAGFPNGFRVTLHARQILQETAQIIREQMRRIGIVVDLKVLPDSEFFRMLNNRDYSFFLSRVGATVGDASDVLEPQIHSPDSKRHYGARNYAGYFNPAVDKKIEDSAAIVKVEDRREALQDIMSMVMKDLPWIPLYIDQDVYALENSFSWRPRHDSFVLAYEIEYSH